MKIVRTVAAVLLGAGLGLPVGAPAWAHNSLTDAEPAKNAVLQKAPAEIRLTFLQEVDRRAMTLEVTDAQQRPVPIGAPEADGRVSRVEFGEPLGNGVYTVTYRVVSRDGHPVQGSYRFTVDDPAAATPPSPSPPSPSTPAASTAAAQPATEPVAASSDDPPWWLLAGPVGMLALAVAGFYAWRRRPGHNPK